MTAIIIDDERESHEVLHQVLTAYEPDITIVASAFCVEEGLKLIHIHHPQLVFLDIRMPDGTGFDLLKRIGKPDFQVIFITAHDNHAQTAIRFGALDYLLKPIPPDELRTAIQRAREKQQEKISLQQLQILWETLQTFQERKLPLRLGISTSEGVLFHFVKDIIRLEAQQNYTEFTLANSPRKILASVNLGEYEEQFKPYREFMRVHRSHLINLTYVQKYTRGDGGYLVMKDGGLVSVSKRLKDEVLRRLEGL